MTYKIKRIVSILCLVAAIFSAALLPGLRLLRKFTFRLHGR